MHCPRCNNPMQQILQGGVQIDSCGGCGGTFFDGNGELQNFLNAIGAQHGLPAQPVVPFGQHPMRHNPTQMYHGGGYGYGQPQPHGHQHHGRRRHGGDGIFGSGGILGSSSGYNGS